MKKLYIGRCYVCGKPIREDDLYGTMEDSDTLYCEACWNEYANRCDALIEQMKKEKAGQAEGCIFGNTPSENTCRFCGVSCGARVPVANGVSSTELVPSGEAVGLSIMAYLDKNVKHDNGSVCGVRLEVAREWIREKLNTKQALPEAELDKLVNEEFASRSRTTEYGLEVTYNRAELSRFIKRMALVFNGRKED